MDKKQRVLNVLIAGHAQHGKSSLIEAIVGQFPDNLDFEISHGTTVSLKVIQFHLKQQDILINFLDSPGHGDFKGSIALGLDFADLLVLVISGKEGFQARTYWLFDVAKQKGLPIIIAATKMDLSNSDIEKIENELKAKGEKTPIVRTSAKNKFGMEELIEKISINRKIRFYKDSDLEFIILGFENKKGIGEVLIAGIIAGRINVNHWITDEIKVKHIFTIKNAPANEAHEGDIVQIALNVNAKFELGTKYRKGKFLSPRIEGILSEIQPRKEFYLSIDNHEKFKIALDALATMKKVLPSFDYYIDNGVINTLVLGDLQFEFIKERLEDLIEFKIVDSKIKGLITVERSSKARYKSARVKIIPRCRKTLTISRVGGQEKTLSDILGATAASEAFHIDGLHVDIYSGKNEDDIAQAIAKAIEKVKVIKIVPYQDVIVKVENFHDLFNLIDKYDIEVLHQSQTNSFFLQVKNEYFEDFFNSLMKLSKGKADINLFKFEHEDIILAVDPGTRHYGFCLIEKGELPNLWFVNLKKNIDDERTHNNTKKQLNNELNKFLGSSKDTINKIFIGNGPGSNFIIDYFIEEFNIPCEDYSCVSSDLNETKDSSIENEKKNRFSPPQIFLVDEFKTTKEALFHLQQGKLVNEVESKGFVDHAIAALLIAKRGLKGETIKLQKKPLKQLYDYIVDNYSGSYSFGTIHNVKSIYDLKPGMYLRVKDASKLDSSLLNNGDVVSFVGFGTSYTSLYVKTLSGNSIIVKFFGDVKLKRSFFDILVPVKERT